MNCLRLPTTIAIALLTTTLHAGTLANSTWTPSGACGAKPDEPVIDDSDVEAYNKSVAAINEWQQSARRYYECLIKEANVDNALIADTANREQALYRQAVESLGAKAEATKKRLDTQ